MTSKTERPTHRRLLRARQQGDSPVSGSLTGAAAFAAAVAVAPWAGALLVQHSQHLFQKALEQQSEPSCNQMVADVAGPVVVVLAAATVAAVAVGLLQTGGVIAFHRLAPDASRTDPPRATQGGRWWAVFRSTAGAALIGCCAAYLLTENAAALVATLGDSVQALTLSAELAYNLVWMTALVTLGLGLVDWLVVRGVWVRRLMMSHHELQQEHREAEGDPHIRAARRRAHEQVVQASTLAEDTTVLVVGGGWRVVALRYVQEQDKAPHVLGRGEGALGQRMVTAGRGHGIAVTHNDELGQALWNVPVGETIPERLYEPVADTLREVH
jgi:flagellar biosynthesis protein FlhB